MSILPRLSIATKLYAILALLAIATVALAAVAVVNAWHHNALTQEFEAASQGAKHVERLNGLVYAVAMESRGIYMSADAKAASPFHLRAAQPQ
jgi:methyl-accepting chemotaxis protein